MDPNINHDHLSIIFYVKIQVLKILTKYVKKMGKNEITNKQNRVGFNLNMICKKKMFAQAQN